jgi:glutamine amidotransferase
MILVVDYGMGNLRNVKRAFNAIGREVLITAKPSDLPSAEHIVLPGVGAFGEAVRRIDSLRLRAPLLDHVASGRPLLGICLGMQLLFERSEESPGTRGLGILPGEVVRLRGDVKVPHIGWNDAEPVDGRALLEGLTSGGCFYFVHSYCVPDSAARAGLTTYGETFVSAVSAGTVTAFQFHPEKSQTSGLELLRRFVDAGKN